MIDNFKGFNKVLLRIFEVFFINKLIFITYYNKVIISSYFQSFYLLKVPHKIHYAISCQFINKPEVNVREAMNNIYY